MTDTYSMKSTSLRSATIEDRVLSCATATRRIIRPIVVENTSNPVAGVKITLIHQRKSPKEEWGDTDSIDLKTLKAGEGVKLALDSEETLKLHNELTNLYAISSSGGVRFGETDLVVGRENEIILTDRYRAPFIRKLLSKGHKKEVWEALIEVDPDLATKLSIARIHTERKKTLKEFKVNLATGKTEDYWQKFFEENTWIFGYGLNYQILKSVQVQPNYGGANVSGKGTQKGDFLQKTEGICKFTVLVEVKKPQSELLGKKQYRNGAFDLGENLTGGVSQLQANCRTWDLEGSRSSSNQELMNKESVYTYQPKGILVVGNTDQLDNHDKRSTFESFRRNIVNPEIITFDELFERTKFIVENSSPTF